jgi:hypothetical protein
VTRLRLYTPKKSSQGLISWGLTSAYGGAEGDIDFGVGELTSGHAGYTDRRGRGLIAREKKGTLI